MTSIQTLANTIQARQQPPPPTVYVAPTSRTYQNDPQWYQAPQQQQPWPIQQCAFCSGLDHHLGSCNVATTYVNDGRLIRTQDRRLASPSGHALPPHITGRNLKERFNSYLQLNQNANMNGNQHPVASTHYRQGNFDSTSAMDISPVGPSSTDSLTAEEELD